MTNTENDNGGTISANNDIVAVKKTALRDVQNQNIGSGRGRGESENFSFLGGGGQNKDASFKMCGNKRLTPEPPPSAPALLPNISKTCGNELVMNAWKRFELELGVGGRIQNNAKHVDTYSRSKQSHVEGPQKNIIQPKVVVSRAKPHNSGPSAPNYTKKHAAQIDSVKVSIDSPDSNALKKNTDDNKQRVERITRLEKFLKDCDQTNSKDYFTMLRHLSPSDLSRHAFELEKRAIRLTIEEGIEMQRMKVLNVLEKPFSSNDQKHTLQPVQAKK